MSSDKESPDERDSLAPELEARVAAWVLGEASAFEAAELERLCARQPELAVFKRRISAVHGLVGAAARPEREPLRLSPERRQELLGVIGSAPGGDAAGAPAVAGNEAEKGEERHPRRWWRSPVLAAGVATVALAALTFLVLPGLLSVREEARLAITSLDESRDVGSALRDDGAAVRPAQTAPAKMPTTPGSLENRAPARAAEPAPLSLGDEVRRGVDRRGGRAEGSSLALAAPVAPLLPQPPPYPDSFVSGGRIEGDKVIGTPSSRAPGAGGKDTLELAGGDRVDGPIVDHRFSAFRSGVGSADSEFFRRGFNDAGAPAEEPRSETEANRRETRLEFLNGERRPIAKAKSELDAVGQVAAAEPEEQAAPVAPGESGKEGAEKKAPGEPLARPSPAAKADAGAGPAETSTAVEPVSTFSLHVSDVSFRLAQAALARGEAPDPTRIRPEEFYNAFDYGDPAPLPGEPVACRIEQAAHPFLQQRNLVRIAARVPATGRGAGVPLRLTVLLDTSGSMEREDRAASVQRALEALASLLGPDDRVTLLGFARQPRLLAEALPGNEAAKLSELAARTPAGGGTNLAAALELAFQKAQQHFVPAAQNRVVLVTDGAANLGDADPGRLAVQIEEARQRGLAFDACGVGLDGLDDAVLEALTRKGDGRYYVLDAPAEADAGFARQLAGAFRPAARNVKLQVRFNPARVAHYRLIGFEQHRLREEDFRNDQIDAAELAAEEAAVALYQVEVLPGGEGELGDVYVRFHDTAANRMVERSWTMPFEPRAPAFGRSAPAMQLAGVAALLAERLRGGALAEPIQLDELAPVVNALRGHYPRQARVRELAVMFEQARRL